ncbi:hypothetical protein JW921_03860, partial [Candidatus Fermentibacterales bacterium]|nr:hypothetical protein [Candidatus Fermentibacterales bacterium]
MRYSFLPARDRFALRRSRVREGYATGRQPVNTLMDGSLPERGSGRSGPGSRALLILLIGVCALYSMFPISNGNFFWHIRNGEDIVQSLHIRTTDPFTLTRQGCEWLQAEWLAEVLLYLPWSLAGGAGVVILKMAVICTTVLLCLRAARARGASPEAAVLVAVVALSVAHGRWIARPHIFTDLFFALYLVVLGRSGRRLSRDLALILPLQVLWVNLHAGFTMGLFLLGLDVLDPLFSRAWRLLRDRALLLLASIAVCGVHPNGYGSIRYTTSFLHQGLFRESIREWWSPFDPRFQPGHPFSRTALAFILVCVALVLALVFARKRLKLSRCVGLAALVAASSFAARNLELLALAMIAWIPPLLPRVRAWVPSLLLLLAALVVPLHGIPREFGPPRSPGLGVQWDVYPVGLADFLERNDVTGNVFNSNEIAGYLEYRLGESLPLFMDGRCLLYPEDLFAEYLVLATAPDSIPAPLQVRLLDEWDINLILTDWPDARG